MAHDKWWQPFDAAAEESKRQRTEPDVVTELTFALDAATWFQGREASNDCAS